MVSNLILDDLQKYTDVEKELKNSPRADSETRKYSYLRNGIFVQDPNRLLSSGKLISIHKHTRFRYCPEHMHDYVEVVYMCKGQTVHHINGDTVVLGEGELLFLGQSARQSIEPAGEDDIAVNFIILPEFFNKSLEMMGAEESPLRKFLIGSLLDRKNNKGYLHFMVKDVLPVQNLIENLLYTLIKDIPNKRSVNQITMGLLIMQLLNCSDKLVYNEKNDAVVVALLRYIEENYQNGNLGDAAKQLHYDFFWLSREIHARTGKTFTELMQNKRMLQAAFLLKTTDESIDEISSAVGYENKSFFHRLFLEYYGTTPKKYRDSNK